MKRWLDLVKQTFRDFFEDKCTRLAAALSYYTIFSLPPLLVLLLFLLSAVLDPQDVRGLLEGQLGSLLGPAGSNEVRAMLEHAEQPDFSRGAIALVGIGALLFGAVGAFVEMQNALNTVWEVQPDPQQGGIKRFIVQRIVSFGMLLTIVFFLIVSLVVSTVLTAFGGLLDSMLPDPLSGVVLRLINLVVSLGVLSLLFALLFRHVPDARIEWRDVAFGAVATALLFTVGKYVLGLYLGRSNPGDAFGAASALALLLVWIYYSALIVFLGAEFTQAWAKLHGRGVQPAEGAVRVVETKQVLDRTRSGSRTRPA
jgi:membrane protein